MLVSSVMSNVLNLFTETHTTHNTTVLLLFWNMSGATRVSRYQKGKTRKVKANLDLLEQEIVSGSGICWAICKSAPPPRQPRQHPDHSVFLQAGCPSCRPTNSVKALKALVHTCSQKRNVQWTKQRQCETNIPQMQANICEHILSSEPGRLPPQQMTWYTETSEHSISINYNQPCHHTTAKFFMVRCQSNNSSYFSAHQSQVGSYSVCVCQCFAAVGLVVGRASGL